MHTKEYAFRHYVEHRATAGKADALFHVLEQKPFLADQAAHLGSFRQGTEDLLSFALPWAIQSEDWNRFLRFALRALNFGRMSRSLARPEVLGALAASGWPQLAIDVAAEQPETAGRIRALAVIAGRFEDGAERRSLLARIGEDLRNLTLPRDPDGAAPLAEILRSIVREIDPQDWPGGERMLAPLQAWPDLVDAVWIAAAEGCLRRSNLADDRLWTALRHVQSPDRLRTLLPFPLVDAPGELTPFRLKAMLPELPPDLFWHTSFALLGRQARKNPGDAVRSWEAVSRGASIPWSADLIETGRELFRNMGAERIRRLAKEIAEEGSRAALWTLCLEGGGDQSTAQAAFEAIRRLPPGPDQVHWSLRYLRADRVSPIEHIRHHTEAARHFLLQTGYAASPRDLALYLDQIAEILPERCATELQNAAGHLGGLPALLELAETITLSSLRLEIHERAEALAAVVARGRREAAQTASRILASLAARLCVERGDLLYLQITSLRLPPGEEDPLRVTVAEQLHRAGRPELAAEVVAGIRSSAARRTALLDLWPERAESLFREPASLYAAFADVAAIEDERLGLTALHASPADPEGIADRWLRDMTPGPTATAAVLRMARHTLAYQHENGSEPRDILTILHFVERSLTAGSLSRSAAWLPAIVELGATLGSHRLPLELRAASTELFSRPWEETGEIFEDLLLRLRSSLPPNQMGTALLALLHSLREISDAKKQREWTLNLLPLLAATAERLPDTFVQRALRHAGELAFHEDPAPSEAGFIAQLCGTEGTVRLQAAQTFVREQTAIILGRPFHVLALLVSQTAPETAVALMQQTPRDSQRDEAFLRMIRYRWLPDLQARELQATISQPALALEAGLFLDDEARLWLQTLARSVTSRSLDPSAPSSGPILDQLWQLDPRLSRPCLADAALAALRMDPEHGEQAIRIWLHAHLPPRLGAAQVERQQESEDVAGVLRQALTLATSDGSQPASFPDKTPSPGEIEQMADWLRRRNHTAAQTFLWGLRRESTWVVPHAFLAAAILFVLADFEINIEGITEWSWPLRILALPLHLLVWTHTSPAWMAVLAVFPLNALLLHGILEQETPREDLRPWIPKLRFFLGGTPLLGLYMLPAWRKLMKSRPSWAFRRTRTRILDDSRAWSSVAGMSVLAPGSWLTRLQSSPRFLFLWLWVVNLVAVRLATSRLSAADVLHPDLRHIADWTLRLLGFAATASLLKATCRNHPVTGRDRKVCWMLAGTWIFPFPTPLLALSAPGYARFRRQTTGTLSTGTQGTGSPPEWALLLKLLRENARKIPLHRRPWGLELPRRSGLAQQSFLSLCRVKTLLLILDSLLLTLVLWKVAHEGLPGYKLAAFVLLATFVCGAIFLQIAGWAGWRISALRRLVRSGELGDRNEPHPYARALTITATATLAGVAVGLSLGQKNPALLGFFLITIGVVGITAVILPELKPGSVGPDLKQFLGSLIARQVLFLTIGYLGVQAWRGEAQAAAIMGRLSWVADLSPALALGIGLLGYERLLRPFQVRHLFSSRLPLRARLILAFFLITLALPLGGLAVPVWIWARERLWPEWERDLSPAAGETS